jgi:hypothetical protein
MVMLFIQAGGSIMGGTEFGLANFSMFTQGEMDCVGLAHGWIIGWNRNGIGSDTTVFPKSKHILAQMYSGGLSSVLDASTFFYQFMTHPTNRKYLELLHPITNLMYQYRGMPMGCGNSLALPGQYGTAFMRLLKRRCSLFQGSPSENTWRFAFGEGVQWKGETGGAGLLW